MSSKPTTEDLLKAFLSFRGYLPYRGQQDAVTATTRGVWVLAGPGTGKTEALILRVLKLLLVDRVPPESILLTTFTTRAAAELETRLSLYIQGICRHPPFDSAPQPNLSGLWLGTLHSLAYDVLRQHDDQNEQLVLLDQHSSMFVLLRAVTSGTMLDDHLYEVLNGERVPAYLRYNRFHHGERLFAAISRTAEDFLDMRALDSDIPLRGEPSPWHGPEDRETFLELLDAYVARLGKSTDFSRLQLRFLDFLTSPRSAPFLKGDARQQLPGIRHVIVDEYQDTNPIQEALYFALCGGGGGMTVVGDDDQALYRFRGASVDAILGFAARAEHEWGSGSVTRVELDENRRSHQQIVNALNHYVSEVSLSTTYSQGRLSKSALKARSSLTGDHDSFIVLLGDDDDSLAAEVARAVQQLQSTGQISDFRQVALLSYSTKVSSRSRFRAYHSAFERSGIPLFNPGAKDLHRDRDLRAILGLMCHILDPHETVLRVEGQTVRETIGEVRLGTDTLITLKGTATAYLSKHRDLANWVDAATKRIDQPAPPQGARVRDDYPTSWNLLDLFYGLANLSPFADRLAASGGPMHARSAWRMGWFTSLLESFQHAQPQMGRLHRAIDDEYVRSFFTFRGRPAPTLRGVSPHVIDSFYRDFVGLFTEGGFNEIEDELQAIPAGAVPALTIHQSKGLEFPIVFVTGLGEARRPGPEHHQEDFFHPYRRYPMASRMLGRNDRAVHDEARRLFVAMSRAKILGAICLTRPVYDEVVSGDSDAARRYPHIPRGWLENLPLREVAP